MAFYLTEAIMAAPKTAETFKHRTADGMIPGKMKERRDRFVTFLVMGNSRRDAAILAGVPPRSANKTACQLMAEPYVQEQYRKLRDAVSEEQLVCRKDILIGLLSEARSTDDPTSTQAARVQAWMNVARIMGYEKPVKVDVNVQGGVMIVPMSSDPNDWEKLAAEQQETLKIDVKS